MRSLLSSQGGVDHKSHFEWHIIPVLNPDGYVHTWTRDRMWRKNRFLLQKISTLGLEKYFFSGSPRLLRVMSERTSTEISPSVGSTGRNTRRATRSGVRGHSPLWRYCRKRGEEHFRSKLFVCLLSLSSLDLDTFLSMQTISDSCIDYSLIRIHIFQIFVKFFICFSPAPFAITSCLWEAVSDSTSTCTPSGRWSSRRGRTNSKTSREKGGWRGS